MAALVWAMLRRRERHPMALAPELDAEPGTKRRLRRSVELATLATLIILLGLTGATYAVVSKIFPVHPHTDLTIELTGHRWWWEARYVLPGSNAPIVTANEIHVPASADVTFVLRSDDVIDPQPLGAQSRRQDGPHPRADEHADGARRPARHLSRPVRGVPRLAARLHGAVRRRRGAAAIRAMAGGAAPTRSRARQSRRPRRPRRVHGELRELPSGARHGSHGDRWPRPHASRQPRDDRGGPAASPA